MPLALTRALTDGIRRTITPTGIILIALTLIFQTLLIAALNTLTVTTTPPDTTPTAGLVLPLSETAALLLLTVAFIYLAAYYVIIARALTRPLPELTTFPPDLYTRRLGPATLWMAISGLLVTILVTIGLFLFLLPGIFLAASFFYIIFTIGFEDRTPIDGLQRSWRLSKGHRLRLSILIIILSIVSSLLGGIGLIFSQAGSPLIGDILTIIINSILFVFIYGIMASVYLQTRDSTQTATDH